MADMEEEEGSSSPSSSGSDGKETLGQKMKKAPTWVWISIAIAAGTLIIGILSYKNQKAKQQAGTDTSNQNGTDPNAATSGQDATGGYYSGGGYDPGIYNSGSDLNSIDSNVQQLMQEVAQILNQQQTPGTQGNGAPPPVPGPGPQHHHKGGHVPVDKPVPVPKQGKKGPLGPPVSSVPGTLKTRHD